MTLQTLAAALASGALLLGGCQSTHQHHSISIIELTEVPVDFAFAGVSSVPIPAAYTLRPDGITVFERWSNTYPGLAAPVTFATGVVGTDRPEAAGIHFFDYAVYSCIEGCEQIADEGVWERVEVAYAVGRLRSEDEDDHIFEPGSIRQHEYTVGDSWCHGYGGIRQRDGLVVDVFVCAEQYTGADGSLHMRQFYATDETLIPGAVNTLFASLPP